MYWDDFRKAFGEAERTLAQADDVAAQMARMLVGRLRKCSPGTLSRLKTELRDFDARSGEWKE